MADKNKIPLKSSSVDSKGAPLNTTLRRFEEDTVRIKDSITDEVKVVTVMKPIVDVEGHINVSTESIPKGTYLLFPGTKLTLKVAEGQLCPEILPIGQFSLIKGYVFNLEYCDKSPEDGTGIPKATQITMGDPFTGSVITRENRFYPSHINTQKELIDYIVEQPGFHSPLVAKKIEHAPEYAEKLQVQKLRVRRQEMSDYKRKELEKIRDEEAKFVKEVLPLADKYPELKDFINKEIVKDYASEVEESEEKE